MDQLLQKVVGVNKISMMHGFAEYNQVSMSKEDNDNKTFTTPSGTFMYDKMPFGLMKEGATFQNAMDIDVVGDTYKLIVIYHDDMNVYSKIDEDNLSHLKQAFNKCRKYGLSLKPKKSSFSL